jgi:hypothetical protein
MSKKDITFFVILGVGNIPIYILLGKLLFEDWEGFKEAVGYLFTPDFWSFFEGEWLEDRWAELKLGLFVILCGALWLGELVLITKIFY